MSYEELKQAKDLKIKDWFKPQSKLQILGKGHLIENIMISRETEKAVLVSLNSCTWNGTEYLTECWIPKSCFESYSEYQKNEKIKEANYEKACEKYDKLVAFCKTNKIKGARVGLRTVTLLNKIEQAGLSYSA